MHHLDMNDSTHPVSSSLTRRRILGWSGVGIIAGVTGYLGWPKNSKPVAHPGTGTTQRAADTARPMADEPMAEVLVGREAFVAHLKSEFQIESADHSLASACRLIEVSDEISLTSPTARFTSFSLLFTAPKGFAAQSQIYRLTHPQMEPMDLFLSPVGKSDEVVHLEAVCSQKV